MSAFDAYIKQQLSVLESTFFPSLQGDVTELEGFNKSWTTFNALIASTEDLTDETRLLVASFAEIGETVASALLEVETASDHIYNQLENELARITEEALNGLSIQDTSPQASQSSPPYIGLCSTWLLKNLHNPYPSPEIRKKISMETNSSPRHVESWFIDVRKRIGWNDIRKKYFAKRADMIKAATRVLVESSPLSLHDAKLSNEIHGEFVAMYTQAMNLYSARLPIPMLGRKDAPHSYPSPAGSPDRSPEPSSSSALPPLSPVSVNLRKRSYSSTDDHDGGNPRKRNRIESSPRISIIDAVSSLPSPADSTRELDGEVEPPGSVHCLRSVSPPPPIPRKRKRSDSDAGLDRSRKRPNSIQDTQRISFDTNDPQLWETQIPTEALPFDMTVPPPVQAAVPDGSTEFEVESHNLNFLLPHPSQPKQGEIPANEDYISIFFDSSIPATSCEVPQCTSLEDKLFEYKSADQYDLLWSPLDSWPALPGNSEKVPLMSSYCSDFDSFASNLLSCASWYSNGVLGTSTQTTVASKPDLTIPWLPNLITAQ